MFSKRSVETPRLIMITTYTNMTYDEYQGMFDIVGKKGSTIKLTYIVDRYGIFVLRYKALFI